MRKYCLKIYITVTYIEERHRETVNLIFKEKKNIPTCIKIEKIEISEKKGEEK